MIVRTILKDKSSADVATTVAGQKVGDAAKLLDQRRIGALVVVDEQRSLAGILSERDLVHAGRHHRQHHECHDQQPDPPSAGGRGRQAGGHHHHR